MPNSTGPAFSPLRRALIKAAMNVHGQPQDHERQETCDSCEFVETSSAVRVEQQQRFVFVVALRRLDVAQTRDKGRELVYCVRPCCGRTERIERVVDATTEDQERLGHDSFGPHDGQAERIRRRRRGAHATTDERAQDLRGGRDTVFVLEPTQQRLHTHCPSTF